MASYVEKLIDLLEKQTSLGEDVMPKMLREDIEWAIELIGSNKLYTGDTDVYSTFDAKKPEIQAWLDIVKLKNIPKSEVDIERLKDLDEIHALRQQKKVNKKLLEKLQKQQLMRAQSKASEDKDESQQNLLSGEAEEIEMVKLPPPKTTTIAR